MSIQGAGISINLKAMINHLIQKNHSDHITRFIIYNKIENCVNIKRDSSPPLLTSVHSVTILSRYTTIINKEITTLNDRSINVLFLRTE